MKSVFLLLIVGCICLLSISTEAKNKMSRTFSDGMQKETVELLEKQWGSNARIYWNDTGFVVIANDGYVSEFDRSGETIHTGHIR